MAFEGIIIYSNIEHGNLFAGHVKINHESKLVKDKKTLSLILSALKKNDRIVRARVEQFMRESTLTDGSTDIAKFLALAFQEVVCGNWYEAVTFCNNLGLPNLLDMSPLAIQLKMSKSVDSRDQGYFIYKIEGWTGDSGYLDRILNDVATYYKETNGIMLYENTLPPDESSFLPVKTPTIELYPRRLIGLEEVPVKVCGVSFASRTRTEVGILKNEKEKTALLLINGRALMGEKDWDGKITGLTQGGTLDLIKDALEFQKEHGVVRNYDVVHYISSTILKK